MAHSIKVEIRPAKNKDGSDSKRKKIYTVIDRHRKHRVQLAEVSTQDEVDSVIELRRESARESHLKKHPNDTAYRRKHGLL